MNLIACFGFGFGVPQAAASLSVIFGVIIIVYHCVVLFIAIDRRSSAAAVFIDRQRKNRGVVDTQAPAHTPISTRSLLSRDWD
jgi:hypothetical protein